MGRVRYRSGDTEQDKIDTLQPHTRDFERFYGSSKEAVKALEKKPDDLIDRFIDKEESEFDPNDISRTRYYI